MAETICRQYFSYRCACAIVHST